MMWPPHYVPYVRPDSWRRLRVEPHRIACTQLPELGHDAVGVAHVAADEVFEPRVTVEPALILPDLHEPGPDLPDGGVDGDGVSRLDVRVLDKLSPLQKEKIVANSERTLCVE